MPYVALQRTESAEIRHANSDASLFAMSVRLFELTRAEFAEQLQTI